MLTAPTNVRIGTGGPPPTGNPHAYFEALAARSDRLATYHLRSQTQVAQYRSNPNDGVHDLQYLYPNDPDPRQQDAMKLRIRELKMGPSQQLRVPLGSTGNAFQHLLITIDFWLGLEFAPAHSRLVIHKGTPLQVFRQGDASTAGMWLDYANAGQFLSNQPAGGPYVGFAYCQVYPHVKRPETWRDTDTGFPRMRLPYTESDNQRRSYTEGIMPVDASIDPAGVELGIVGERWHRIWHYFERAPGEDFTTTDGVARSAYQWSMWMADTVREPMRAIDERIVGVPTTLTKQFTQVRIEFGPGQVNLPSQYVGRGDLIAYYRNMVALVGTSKADVLPLLQRPV